MNEAYLIFLADRFPTNCQSSSDGGEGGEGERGRGLSCPALSDAVGNENCKFQYFSTFPWFVSFAEDFQSCCLFVGKVVMT